MKWARVALVVALVVAGAIWALVSIHRAEKRCEARGGVYLWREGKCVPGFKR